jgi:hypothetical protein
VAGELVVGLIGVLCVVFVAFTQYVGAQTKATPHNTLSMITKAIESAVWLNLTIKPKAKETICLH